MLRFALHRQGQDSKSARAATPSPARFTACTAPRRPAWLSPNSPIVIPFHRLAEGSSSRPCTTGSSL